MKIVRSSIKASLLMLSFSVLIGCDRAETPVESPTEFSIADFDKDGMPSDESSINELIQKAKLEDPTHIFLISHGWNTSPSEANRSYAEMVQIMDKVAESHSLRPDEYRPFVVGISWPSLSWDSERSRQGENTRGEPLESESLSDEIKTVLPRQLSPTTYETDVAQLESLLTMPQPRAPEAQIGQTIELLRGYSLPPQMPEDRSIFDDPSFKTPAPGARGAKIENSALDFFRVFSFWQMKKRAGLVGRNGVRELLLGLLSSCPDAEVHLVGHSFGTKVFLSALSDPLPRPVESATLLQGAISAFAFADVVPGSAGEGGYRPVLAGERVKGPLVLTYTLNDKALAAGYPVGARLGNQTGDLEKNDVVSRYAALGAFGAQNVGLYLADDLEMGREGASYQLSQGLYNIEANDFIGGHSDYQNRAVAWLIWSAVFRR